MQPAVAGIAEMQQSAPDHSVYFRNPGRIMNGRNFLPERELRRYFGSHHQTESAQIYECFLNLADPKL